MPMEKETREAIKEAKKDKLIPFDWQKNVDFTTSESGSIRPTPLNVSLLLEHDPSLKNAVSYDDFSDTVVRNAGYSMLSSTQAGEWNDQDDSLLRLYFERTHHLVFKNQDIVDGVIGAAKGHKYNPVKKRIEAVQWDGKARVANYFIDTVGAENNAYTKAVTETWFTGAVARVYHPGIKFELVPILMGAQGLGKSTTVRNIFPEKFNDNMESMGKSKDDYQQLLGSWIIEVAELSALRQTEVERVKSFISSQDDRYRPSYGRRVTTHPRKCVFIGTTNQNDFLKDSTGARRFMPIKCGVSKPTVNVWNVDQNYILQVLAEAKHLYDQGHSLYLPDDILKQAAQYQEDAEIIDPTKEAVGDYLNIEVPTNWDDLSVQFKQGYVEDYPKSKTDPANWRDDLMASQFVPLKKTNTREIMAVVFHKTADKFLSGRTNTDAKKIKLIMDNMDGWEYKRIRVHGKQARFYVRS